MAALSTSCGMTCTERKINSHSCSIRIRSVPSEFCSSRYGSPSQTFSMRDLLNAARQRKPPSGNGSSAMSLPTGSRRIQNNVSTGSRHGMNCKEYETIMGYLEDPEHLAEILGSGRKTKVLDSVEKTVSETEF
ncbi:hypothetical protein R1sor_012024 [Riccia sorocarpa]|uniref:Uncharacterized protein n=1 Tax=Riccia sorocarpa TaxID=122646 RepID=A0ABD3I2M1_9MARC